MKKLAQLLVASMAWASVAAAGLDKGSPLLSYISPGGGGQGEVVEVQFYGSNLHDPVDVLFYDPAIKLVEFIEPEDSSENVAAVYPILIELVNRANKDYV